MPTIPELEKDLDAAIVFQEQTVDAGLADAKAATKTALFALLRAISAAPKEDLSAEARQLIDELLVSHATILKWPLLRALSVSEHHRALLGLPETLERTRRGLTTISSAKLQEILVVDLDVARVERPQELAWVEQVLAFLTGDGRRKRDLDGFVLRDKGPVRAALNQAKRRRQVLARAEEGRAAASLPKSAACREMEQDVRAADAERHAARARDFASLVDDAVRKK